MEIGDAHRALRVLAAAFPTYPFGEDTQEIYLAALVTKIGDGDAAFDAARNWVFEQDRFPTVNQLLAACRLEARRREPAPLALVVGGPRTVPPIVAATRQQLRPRPKGDQQ